MQLNTTYTPAFEREGNNLSQTVYRFDNNFGASVVRGEHTYGGEQGLFELALIRFTGPTDLQFKIDYGQPVPFNVVGWLSPDEVDEYLTQIKELPCQPT